MEASEEYDFYCPLCGCNLLWMPVSRIFVCEHCKESFSESAKYYLRKKEDVTEGNQQKMREALALCMSDMCKYCKAEARACGLPQCLDGCETLKTAKAALAAPPRQCDVGTADEQYKRMEEYCDERHCDECPWFHAENCQLAWAQMPYEAEGGAGNEND